MHLTAPSNFKPHNTIISSYYHQYFGGISQFSRKKTKKVECFCIEAIFPYYFCTVPSLSLVPEPGFQQFHTSSRPRRYCQRTQLPDSINGLTIVYKVQGQFDEAEPLLLEAVDGRVLNLGDIHPHTLQSLNNLIALDKAWKKPKSGKQNCRK